MQTFLDLQENNKKLLLLFLKKTRFEIKPNKKKTDGWGKRKGRGGLKRNERGIKETLDAWKGEGGFVGFLFVKMPFNLILEKY